MKYRTILLISLILSAGLLSAQTATLQFDQARSDSVFVDVGGGIKTSTFPVQGRLQSLVFVVLIQGGNPVLEFVTPQGIVLGLDSPRLEVQRQEWGVLVGLKSPDLGLWTIRLSQTLGEGSYQVKTFAVPAAPTLSLQTPSFPQEPWSAPKTVTGTTQPDQAGKTVAVSIADVSNSQFSLQLGQTTVAPDGSLQVILDPREVPAGEYQVKASLDQGTGSSVVQIAQGTLLRTQPPLLGPVKSLLTLVDQPDALVVSFDDDYGNRPATFHLHVQPLGGADKVVDLGMQTHARIAGFGPGEARAWVTGVDSQGREGASSAIQAVTFGQTPPTPPVLTLEQNEIAVTLSSATAAARVSLSGAFFPRGLDVDYLQATVGDIPPGLSVRPDKSPWYLPTDATQLTWSISADSTLLPGTYRVPLVFSTVGQTSNAVTATLVVTQPVPPPAITSVTPDHWLLGQTPTVELDGTHFALGTRVWVDDLELPIASFTDQLIRADVPASLTSGTHTISLGTSDGNRASTVVTVLEPQYSILAYKSVSKTTPGGTARYWLGLVGLNGFSGATSFQVGSLPSGWTADVGSSVSTPGSDTIISVHVPANAAVGDSDFVVTTPEGGRADLRASVLAAAPDPFISSLGSYAELVGGRFVIRGYGFGAQAGVVSVDDQTWAASTWSDDEISVVVPPGAKTGLLRVRTLGARLSNGITFGVKDYGFQFHTNQLEFRVQGGETKAVDFQLTGYPQAVSLTAQSPSQQLVLHLDRASVMPLGLTRLVVDVDKNIPVGQYPVTLSGTSGLFQTSITLTLRVGSAFEWENPALPSALVQTAYAVRLSTRNSDGAVSYRIKDGSLPPGLNLAKDQISGRAAESGSYRVILEAADAAGHVVDKEFVLVVDDSAWTRPGRDESSSYFSSVDAPADARSLWTSSSVGTPRDLLAAGSQIYAKADDHVQAFFGLKGQPLYRIDGQFTDWQLSQGRLFALDAGGGLGVWEASFGVQAWSRSDVSRFWVKPGLVLAQTGLQVQEIDAGLGTLIRSLDTDLNGRLIGWKGDLYRLAGAVLQVWNDTMGWSEVYRDPQGLGLVLAQGDADALYLQNTSQQVISWTGAGTPSALLWQGSIHQLVVMSDLLIVDNGSSLDVRRRSDGVLLRSFPGGGYDEVLASKTKLFTVRQNTLSALNLTTGGVIWQAPASWAILVGDRLFGMDASGSVTAYNAPENLQAPVTTLSTLPPQPDGAQGWFVTTPKVTLTATDVETFAASTVWKQDVSDWQPYAPWLPTDGFHTVAWHSVDTAGMVESDHIASLRVDTRVPTTAMTVAPAALAGLTNVYGRAVTLTLSSQDATSGVAAVEYRINGGDWQPYSQSVSISTEGFYTVDYRARDQAGNVEAFHSQALVLDYQDPAASALVQDGDQAHFVFLSGADPGTGLNRLEYQIDSGAVQVYTDAVPFTTTGRWNLAYRAVDNAGRSSAWQSVRVENHGPSADQSVGKITYDKSLKGRDLVPDFEQGTPLFQASGEKALSAPDFLAGSAYLRGRDTDSQSAANPWISISVTGPTVVTYLKDPTSQAVLTGWTAGASVPAGTLSKKYFPQGHLSYTKTLNAGETLVLSGPKLKTTGGDLVFVRALWAGVQIVRPRPDDDFYPGQTVLLKAYPSTATDISWSLSDARNPIGSGNPFTWTVPASLEGRMIVLRAQSPSLGAADQQSHRVLRQERLFIYYPNNHDFVTTNAKLIPLATVRPSDGMTPPTSEVTWTLSFGGKIIYQGSGPLPVTQVGTYHLRGEVLGSRGQNLSSELDFTAKAERSWVKWKWRDHRLGPWDDDQGDGIDGSDLPVPETKEARFGATKKMVELWTWKRDSEYRQEVPNGLYDVKMVVGPLAAWDVKTLTVGMNMLNITAKQDGQMLIIQGRVAVTDNLLRIRGTEGLGMYSVAYQLSESGTASGLTSSNIDDVGGLE